jgi:hypothetical protein
LCTKSSNAWFFLTFGEVIFPCLFLFPMSILRFFSCAVH